MIKFTPPTVKKNHRQQKSRLTPTRENLPPPLNNTCKTLCTGMSKKNSRYDTEYLQLVPESDRKQCCKELGQLKSNINNLLLATLTLVLELIVGTLPLT